VQPDEELQTAISLEAKSEPSPYTEKVFLIHNLRSGKLLVHDPRKQVLYTLRTNTLGSGQTTQSKIKSASKQANKQKKRQKDTCVYSLIIINQNAK